MLLLELRAIANYKDAMVMEICCSDIMNEKISFYTETNKRAFAGIMVQT